MVCFLPTESQPGHSIEHLHNEPLSCLRWNSGGCFSYRVGHPTWNKKAHRSDEYTGFCLIHSSINCCYWLEKEIKNIESLLEKLVCLVCKLLSILSWKMRLGSCSITLDRYWSPSFPVHFGLRWGSRRRSPQDDWVCLVPLKGLHAHLGWFHFDRSDGLCCDYWRRPLVWGLHRKSSSRLGSFSKTRFETIRLTIRTGKDCNNSKTWPRCGTWRTWNGSNPNKRWETTRYQPRSWWHLGGTNRYQRWPPWTRKVGCSSFCALFPLPLWLQIGETLLDALCSAGPNEPWSHCNKKQTKNEWVILVFWKSKGWLMRCVRPFQDHKGFVSVILTIPWL